MDFEANLISVRYVCALLAGGRLSELRRVYVLRHIASGFKEQAFTAGHHGCSKDIAFEGREEHTPLGDECAEYAKRKRRVTYLLWHRRFAHLGYKKLKPLYKVCQLTKMRNQQNH